MKIINEMVIGYVRDVLESYVEDHGLAPEELSEYDEYIESVRYNATRHGHFDLLRLGLESLLGRPGVSLKKWAMSDYPWHEEDLRAGLEYMYQKLWPDAGPIRPGGPPGVEIIQCPWEVWNVRMPGTLDE